MTNKAILLFAIFIGILSSCTNDFESQEVLNGESQKQSEEAIDRSLVELYQHRFDFSEDQIRESLATNFNDASWMTKDLNTGNVFTPSSEMKIISVKLQSIDLNTYASKEIY